MAATTTYDYMMDGNLAPSTKLKYLVLESRQIRKLSDNNEVNIDNVLKLRNHLYKFTKRTVFPFISENKFNIQCLLEIDDHLSTLSSNIEYNKEDIISKKLEQLIMLDRPYEEYIKDLNFYEKRLDAILHWIEIP